MLHVHVIKAQVQPDQRARSEHRECVQLTFRPSAASRARRYAGPPCNTSPEPLHVRSRARPASSMDCTPSRSSNEPRRFLLAALTLALQELDVVSSDPAIHGKDHFPRCLGSYGQSQHL